MTNSQDLKNKLGETTEQIEAVITPLYTSLKSYQRGLILIALVALLIFTIYYLTKSEPKVSAKKEAQQKKQQQQQMFLLLLLAAAGAYYFMVYLPEEERKVLENQIQTKLDEVKNIKPEEHSNIPTLLTACQADREVKKISGVLANEYKEEADLFQGKKFDFSRSATYTIYFPPALKEYYEKGKSTGDINSVANPTRGIPDPNTKRDNNALFYGAPGTGKTATTQNICFKANKYPLVEIKGSSLTPRIKVKMNVAEKFYYTLNECNQISNNAMAFDANKLQFIKDCLGCSDDRKNESHNLWIFATNHLDQIEEASYRAGRLSNALDFNLFISTNPNAILKEEIEIEDENGKFKSAKKPKTEEVLNDSLPEMSNTLLDSSNNLTISLENITEQLKGIMQQMGSSSSNTLIQDDIRELPTVATAVVTGGASLVIQAAAIGGAYLVGSALDADRKQKEQEDKKLNLAGKAGEVVSGQVNDLQNRRNKVVQESEELIKEMQKHKAKLNDPNATPEEKELAKKMIPIIQTQLDDKTRIITDYDKKIADLLKNIPGVDNKKGGLINLESMDPQTKMIIGVIVFLVIYFAFIKEKEKD
ncbi:10684_t:CDS:2 [Funneliformis geosporum]|uniref:10684_t:CDS:1 n=1 Tax=Funneliformis geosporum TaxID=1117311 RepID=A0A9W4T1J0_9GLOM|nr:10684_t:CDS:2 [Funneliformis geosporum]